MAQIHELPIISAISYVLAFLICYGLILPAGIKGRALKLAVFGLVLLPFALFLLKPTLSSHLLLALGLILVGSAVFGIKLFTSGLTAVLAYFIVSYGQLCAHVLAFIHKPPDSLTTVLTYSDQWYINLLHLTAVACLVWAYRAFVRFFKATAGKARSDSRMLLAVNGFSLMALLVVSNVYLRFLNTYSPALRQIPQLMSVLVFGFIVMVIVTGAFSYLISLNIFSRLHLHKVKESAERDMQTGVLNRQTGIDTLTERLRECKVHGRPLTICFVDINNLKLVNDKLGHKAGDRLIEVVSETIRSSLRNKDFVCRLGGDEFLVTYCDCGLNQAKAAWNRIYSQLIRKNEDPTIGFAVSVSYGFSEYNAIESLSVMDFIEQADAAMYVYKSKYKQMKKSGAPEEAVREP